MAGTLNPFESRLVRIYWDDGLLDLLSGLGVLLIGVSWQLDLVPLGAIAPALLIPLWKPLRERLTEPRLGYAELSGRVERRTRSFLWTAVAAGTLTFMGGIALYLLVTRGDGATPSGFSAVVPGLPAILLAGLALATAWLVALPRFIAYAAGLVASGLAVAALRLEPGVAFLIAGPLVVTGGLLSVWRFSRRYPKPQSPDAPDAP